MIYLLTLECTCDASWVMFMCKCDELTYTSECACAIPSLFTALTQVTNRYVSGFRFYGDLGKRCMDPIVAKIVSPTKGC